MDNKTLERAEVEDFICWSLQNEHGDVGLETSDKKSEIPLSKLGLQLRAHHSPNKARSIVSHIAERAEQNMAMEKVRLDKLHRLNDLDMVEDHLRIVPPRQRNLALMVLTIISQCQGEVSFDTLARIIQHSVAEDEGGDPGLGVSEHTVSFSTKGLLVSLGGKKDQHFLSTRGYIRTLDMIIGQRH